MYRSNRISSDGHGKKLVATKEMLVEESADYIKERDGALGVTKTFSGDMEVDPHVIEANNQFANTQIIGILSINADGDILYSNTKAQEIFDCPELTGSSVHDFVPDQYFGTNKFKKLHRKLIRSFFMKPFVGGRMLDPGTILRAKLASGRMVPLNVGLEAKLDPITAHPTVVVGYITEAAAIIDQSKVEKMLARATLVVIQQFISQTVVGVISAVETSTIPKLRYGDSTDEAEKLKKCLDYSFYELSTEDKGGEDFKMLVFIVSTALTITISVLPLFVNHMHDHDIDEEKVDKNKKDIFKTIGLFLNDFQEHLSTWKTFRAYDIISVTIIVTIANLFLLYELRTIPDEYGMKTLKECEDVKVIEEKITIAMTVLGIIPGIYLFFKEVYWKIQEWVLNGFTFKKAVTPSEEGTPREPPRPSLSKRKTFESSMNLGSVPEIDARGSGPEVTIDGSMGSVDSGPQVPPLPVLQGYRGSVRVSTINSDEVPDSDEVPTA